MKEIIIKTPLTNDIISKIEPGMIVKINGTIYTARDRTHQLLIENFKSKKKLPFEMKNQIIYYAGPIVSGRKIIACGPTTSARMEPYLEFILKNGIKAIIGKGPISSNAISLLKKYNALYLVATGGAAAFLAKFIKKYEVEAFKEFESEALYKFEVENFPTIAALAKGKYILKS